MKIRKTLTEVLLEVTNKEVMEIAIETLEEERSKFDFSIRVHVDVYAATQLYRPIAHAVFFLCV